MRNGADARLPKDPETGRRLHTLANVYGEMLVQICSDYPALPDFRELTQAEIKFFYEAQRLNLHLRTRPTKR